MKEANFYTLSACDRVKTGKPMVERQDIPPEWRAAQRVLAVRLDNLGDLLVTTPALHAIKQSLPGIELSVLASPVGAQAARLNPDIDAVIAYDSPFIDPWCQLPHDSHREQRLIADLRQRNFDGAIIFTSFRQSALPAAYLCYLAGIPLRLAASLDASGSLLTTRHRPPERMMHEVETALDLVGAIGCATADRDLVVRVPEQARTTFDRRLADWDVDSSSRAGPLVVLHPGASMPARMYPAELYGEVADRLVTQLGAHVVIAGSADERELVARVHDGVRPERRPAALRVAGELPFPELCALIERADLVITNNTGPMHLAAALKTPVVTLFALTNPPEQWGPWRVLHRLLYHEVACQLCYQRTCPYSHECLRLITPQMVLDNAADLLGMGEPTALLGSGVYLNREPAPSPEAVDPESEEFGWRLGAGWRLGSR
jgi:lipopolysaccharide heptosyltransferase II